MEHLWTCAEHAPAGLTVREVHDVVGVERSLAYTTVMTVLDRLSKKGLASRVRDGRAWRYVPTQSRDGLAAETLHQTLGELVGGDRREALRAFLAGSTPAELAELRAALDDFEGAVTHRSGRRGVTRRIPLT